MKLNHLVHAKNGAVYHAGIIADNILKKYPGIKQTAEYSALEDRFFDYTQSCDRNEQRSWMEHYMNKALDMESEARRLKGRGKEFWSTAEGMKYDAALQFIVAFDMMFE